jgi:hypothetical protein
MPTAPALAILLFAVWVGPDGSRELSDVALTASPEACAFVASVLNAAPAKPKDVTFHCRPPQPRVTQ